MKVLKTITDIFAEIIKMVPMLLVGIILGGLIIKFVAYDLKDPDLALKVIVVMMILLSFLAVGLGFSKANKKT